MLIFNFIRTHKIREKTPYSKGKNKLFHLYQKLKHTLFDRHQINHQDNKWKEVNQKLKPYTITVYSFYLYRKLNFNRQVR